MKWTSYIKKRIKSRAAVGGGKFQNIRLFGRVEDIFFEKDPWNF